MHDSDIYLKTELGIEEVRNRALKLPQRVRTMLIMVDGTRDVSQLREAQRTLGAPDDFLATLIAQGLVVSASPAPAQDRVAAVDVQVEPQPRAESASDADKFQAGRKFMNDSAVDLLGFRAFFFTLKLEKCFTVADLQELIPQFSAAIAKGKGAAIARAMEERAWRLLQ